MSRAVRALGGYEGSPHRRACGQSGLRAEEASQVMSLPIQPLVLAAGPEVDTYDYGKHILGVIQGESNLRG
jgi:hypothetical protein